MRPMSPKRQEFYREVYRPMRDAAIGGGRNPCQIVAPGCTGYAEHLHEIYPRGRAGGLEASVRDGAEAAAGDHCNGYCSENPVWAREHGWLARASDVRSEGMTITNSTALPAHLVAALEDDDYDPGLSDLTVTTLLKPARMVWLERQHPEARDRDASEMAQILIGKAVHDYIHARAQRPVWQNVIAAARMVEAGIDSSQFKTMIADAVRALREYEDDLNDNRRLYLRVDGTVVGGQTDYFEIDGGHLCDYKTVSIWEWRRGLREEREQQLNLYAELLRRQNPPIPVNEMTACCIFRDWTATRASYEKDYPPQSIMEIDVPIWPDGEAALFLRERVATLNAAGPDTLCTDEERWISHDFAVQKAGAKRAYRVFDTREDAEELLATVGPEYELEERVGEPTRCKFFCGPGRAGLCEQWNGDGGPLK